MPGAVIVCLIVFGVLAGVTGLAAVSSALRFFRRSASVARRLEPRVVALEDTSDRLARRSEQLALSQATLAESRAALESSVAKLQVLSWALDDVRFLLGLVRAAIPSK